MAITLLFEPKAGADAQYDSVINALKDQGMWPPEGLTYHVASGAGADFKVFEVWESEQDARKFGAPEAGLAEIQNRVVARAPAAAGEEHHQGQVALRGNLESSGHCRFEPGTSFWQRTNREAAEKSSIAS
jgi:hypothetical protein